MAKNNFFTYTIDKDTTLSELSSDKLSVLKGISAKKESFLKFNGESATSNLERIWQRYTKLEQGEQENINKKSSYSLETIKKGTVLLVPEGFVNVDFVAFDGYNVFEQINNSQGYYSDYLEMMKESGYRPSDELKRIEEGDLNSILYKDLNCSVWIWCRALEGVINVSDYVQNLNTSVDGQSNGFRVGLSSVGDLGGLRFGENQLDYFDIKNENFFYNKIQANDIVFIRFEKLVDKDVRNKEKYIGIHELPGNYYDFIGFVDGVTGTKMYDMNSVNFQISGRGLNKIFEDDGAYFYPLLFVENSEKNFINATPSEDDKWFKRNLFAEDNLGGQGSYMSTLLVGIKTIKDSIGFIVNQLSNLGVCGDEVFSGYKDKRTKFIRLTGMSDSNLEATQAKGIWQIVDFKYDEKLGNKGVSADYLQNPNSQLIEMFNSLCHAPFVEFFTDTYKDKLNVIVRQPPFTRPEILNCLRDTITINGNSIIYEDLHWENKYYTSYHLDSTAVYAGNIDSIDLGTIPIIYFPEIAEIFGNRKYNIVSNYIPLKANVGVNASRNLEDYKKRAIDDLKYVIESNCYLPFTENGTIIINGDRRIKARTWIRLGDRGKIAYVDSVSNDLNYSGDSIDRTTILSLSRIMVEKYVVGKLNKETIEVEDPPKTQEELDFIKRTVESARIDLIKKGQPVPDDLESQIFKGVAVSPKKALTYWTTVNIDVIVKSLKNKFMTEVDGEEKTSITNSVSAKLNYGLNKDAFEFFLKRKQLNK